MTSFMVGTPFQATYLGRTYLANYEMHKIFAILSKSNMHCNYTV